MGYEGKRIRPSQRPGTWEWSSGHKMGEFWGEWLIIAAIIIGFLTLGVVVWLAFFVPPPEASPPQPEQKMELEPLTPPLLFGHPRLPPPAWRQKQKSGIPIHWSGGGHHGNGHHGHHDHGFGHGFSPYYYSPYYPYDYGRYSSPYYPYESRSYENRQKGVDRGLQYYEQDERGFRWGRRPSCPSW